MAAGDPTPATFGKNPIDLDKYRSVGIRPTDRTNQTRTTRDELGHETTQHWSDDSRQDVTINARSISAGLAVQEQ